MNSKELEARRIGAIAIELMKRNWGRCAEAWAKTIIKADPGTAALAERERVIRELAEALNGILAPDGGVYATHEVQARGRKALTLAAHYLTKPEETT